MGYAQAWRAYKSAVADCDSYALHSSRIDRRWEALAHDRRRDAQAALAAATPTLDEILLGPRRSSAELVAAAPSSGNILRGLRREEWLCMTVSYRLDRAAPTSVVAAWGIAARLGQPAEGLTPSQAMRAQHPAASAVAWLLDNHGVAEDAVQGAIANVAALWESLAELPRDLSPCIMELYGHEVIRWLRQRDDVESVRYVVAAGGAALGVTDGVARLTTAAAELDAKVCNAAVFRLATPDARLRRLHEVDPGAWWGAVPAQSGGAA